MRIKIEGHGHCVEIDALMGEDLTFTQVVEQAEATWDRTQGPAEPKQQVGFAGQIVERRADSAVLGAGDYQRQPEPVTARGGSLPDSRCCHGIHVRGVPCPRHGLL